MTFSTSPHVAPNAATVVLGAQVYGDTANAFAVYGDGQVIMRRPVTNVTAATLSPTVYDSGTLYTLNKADGITVTLPAATGSGVFYDFLVGTTVTSNNNVIQVTGDDTMTGHALLMQDSADTVVGFETAGTSDTITMNGSTKGGIKGDRIRLTDVAADLWMVEMIGSATGTEASPFSAAVS